MTKEFEEIVMNVVAAIRRGEISRSDAAKLLNDFQDHADEERKARLRKENPVKTFFAILARLFRPLELFSKGAK